MKNKRIFAPERHPKIAHLSDEVINEIIDDYYDGINIKEIIRKYQIDLKSQGLIKLFPPIIVEDRICPYCNTCLWKKLESKGLVNYNYWNSKPYCPTCGHIDKDYCHCKNCKLTLERKRIEETKKIKESIDQRYNLSSHQPIELDCLSIREVIYLSTLIRIGLSEDKKYLKIPNFSEFPVAPSIEMLNSMLNLLLNRKIIVIHPDSPQDAFEDLADITNTRIDIYRIFFHVHINGFISNDGLQFFLQPKIDCITNEKEVLKIWRSIAIEECKSYLKFSLKYVDFPYNASEKAEAIIDNLLNHFSVSQIFGLITRCLGYTTKEFQGGKLTKNSAGAYLLGGVQIQGERAVLKNWELSKYHRPQELPESQLSKLFFSTILNIGDLSIYTKIKSLEENNLTKEI